MSELGTTYPSTDFVIRYLGHGDAKTAISWLLGRVNAAEGDKNAVLLALYEHTKQTTCEALTELETREMKERGPIMYNGLTTDRDKKS